MTPAAPKKASAVRMKRRPIVLWLLAERNAMKPGLSVQVRSSAAAAAEPGPAPSRRCASRGDLEERPEAVRAGDGGADGPAAAGFGGSAPAASISAATRGRR